MLRGSTGLLRGIDWKARLVAMSKLLRSLMVLALVGFVAGSAGFFAFAEAVRKLAPTADARADAIVVLTGDEERIATGVRLMVEGRGRRLLISGVHPTTRVPTELKRRIEGSDTAREALVRCCVDIGHHALNTSGNADEALHWANAHGFGSLIVVTSGYHMLRSLAEFGRAMPSTRLLIYPVTTSRNLRLDAWWRHWPTARLLAGEYVKLLGATARLAVARVLVPHHSGPPGTPPPVGLPSASASVRPGR